MGSRAAILGIRRFVRLTAWSGSSLLRLVARSRVRDPCVARPLMAGRPQSRSVPTTSARGRRSVPTTSARGRGAAKRRRPLARCRIGTGDVEHGSCLDGTSCAEAGSNRPSFWPRSSECVFAIDVLGGLRYEGRTVSKVCIELGRSSCLGSVTGTACGVTPVTLWWSDASGRRGAERDLGR